VSWSKKVKELELKGAILDGLLYEGNAGVKRLSEFPTREEAQGRIVTLAMSPGGRILGIVKTLTEKLEAGETIEECVAREVREETNIEIKHPRYFASQSWPFPNSLMIAFTAEYASGEVRHDPVELADAQWFDLDALPQMPPRLSIARALIDATIKQLRANGA
jgi:NAD+ diphosphatase